MLGRSKHQVTTTITKTHAFLGKCYIVCCDRNAAKGRAQGGVQLGLGHRESPKINGASKGLQFKKCCDQIHATVSSTFLRK